MIRSDLDGTSLNKFQIYPLYYSAPLETDGWWSEPYYDCDGYVNEWVITYSVPFFGFNSIGSALEFKYAVADFRVLFLVTVNLIRFCCAFRKGFECNTCARVCVCDTQGCGYCGREVGPSRFQPVSDGLQRAKCFQEHGSLLL